MQIRLIHPSQLDDSGKPTHYKELCFPSLTLPTVAALTPNHDDVRTTFDAVETIDFDEDVDLVGITALTNNAPRAYQIAKQFRERGKTVVMGGMHATALPDEALQHVNSVVIGEAENNWPRLLKDFEERRELQPIYSSAQLPDLQELSIPRFDLMGLEHCMRIPFKKDEIPVIPIATTRGCPYRCSFCSVTKFFGGTFRTKPISNVLREIEAAKAAGAQTIFFVDDNVMGNADYAEELFTALIPL